MKFLLGFFAVFILIIMMSVGVYNGLTSKEEAVFNAFGNLDSSLQRRYDLIPNLVGAVKGYAKHEKETLEAVINARSKIGSIDAKDLNNPQAIQAFMENQNQLQGSLHRLMLISESYPELKANANFLDLQHQLEGTENRINYARDQYNARVQEFNSSIRSFPASLVNAMFAHLEKKVPFTATESSREAPKVEFN
jgi:LemA protein